jgi:hypothetical protein
MNCFNHANDAAVATCADCGKGLCKECASLYTFPICNECNSNRVKADKKLIMTKYVPSAIGFIVGMLFMTSMPGNSLFSSLSIGYIFAAIPWGWKIISFIQPKMFLFLSFLGWVIYALIKATLAGFVGVVAMPLGIGRLVYLQIIANKKHKLIMDNLSNS